jgi:hypothetical protein
MVRCIHENDSGLVYNSKFREYGIRILDGGSSCVLIDYCPWCSARLPETLRDLWFTRIEDLDIDPYSGNIPEEFLSDAWWKRSDSHIAG